MENLFWIGFIGALVAGAAQRLENGISNKNMDIQNKSYAKNDEFPESRQ